MGFPLGSLWNISIQYIKLGFIYHSKLCKGWKVTVDINRFGTPKSVPHLKASKYLCVFQDRLGYETEKLIPEFQGLNISRADLSLRLHFQGRQAGATPRHPTGPGCWRLCPFVTAPSGASATGSWVPCPGSEALISAFTPSASTGPLAPSSWRGAEIIAGHLVNIPVWLYPNLRVLLCCNKSGQAQGRQHAIQK